jgi:hypothetical protein
MHQLRSRRLAISQCAHAYAPACDTAESGVKSMTHLRIAGLAAMALALASALAVYGPWRQSGSAEAVPAAGDDPTRTAQIVTLPKCNPGQIC